MLQKTVAIQCHDCKVAHVVRFFPWCNREPRTYGMFTHDPDTHATWFSQSIIDGEDLRLFAGPMHRNSWVGGGANSEQVVSVFVFLSFFQ